MKIEIPDLTIAGALFFLFALLLTSFARWYSQYGKKSGGDRGETPNRKMTPSSVNHQTGPNTVAKAVSSQSSDERSKEIRREEHVSPDEIQEAKPIPSDAQTTEQASIEGEITSSQK